ncbi:MAG: zinc metallopeptidase [Cyclobacteriaceae bacterium]|nr:zinc metallopeptidase [Cyclobacteriaceae bacterium]
MIIVIAVVFMIISYAVSNKLKKKFKKYSQTPLQSNLSGAEIAKLMLTDNGIYDVEITCVQGKLTDHYNPSNKTVNLSEVVYHGRNASAAAVASHECGHAVQHATAYSMLAFRSAMVPIQNVSAKVLNFIVMASLFGGMFLFQTFPMQSVLLIVIATHGVITLFSLVTLPVEFDASNRALTWIKQRNIVNLEEHDMAKDALKWAAMTYIVAALGSLVTLLYYVSLFLGSRD